jgi:hypothetical protein
MISNKYEPKRFKVRRKRERERKRDDGIKVREGDRP